VDNDFRWLIAARLDPVTIASHCLALIHARGPLSADELGAACLEAGVTASRQPANAVTSALGWNQDGRVLRVGDTFHAVTGLLEGRWLTFCRPEQDPGVADFDVDLACLVKVVEREGLPLVGGGSVRAPRYTYSGWQWPDGSLPAGETLGLRLIGGVAQLSAVVIDQAAKDRGERLAGLLTKSHRLRDLSPCERRTAAGQELLTLLAEHDDLLREPAPPLSSLLPAPPEEPRHRSWDGPPPFWATVQVHLPPELHMHLEDMALSRDKPLGRWLAEQLEWLAECPPLLAMGPYQPHRDIHEVRERYAGDDSTGAGHDPADACEPWSESPSMLPFARHRGGQLGAS
jgi:hypothetical protein